MSRPRPTRYGRRRASRTTIALRRLLAFGVLVGGFGLLSWAVASAFSGGGETAAPPPPATTRAAVPRVRPLGIIFPEGFTRGQMAARIVEVNRIAQRKRKVRPRLSKREYLRLTVNSPRPGQFAGDGKDRSLEGFLFPARYDFTRKTTTRQLVEQQLEAFDSNWKTVKLAYARSRRLNPYDVLIIASLIEKEVQVPEERRLVSAVIYNRLRQGETLGIDATIRYALGVPPNRSLRQSHLDSSTPYNTRRFPGLPPTPIANPGLASMKAAANPARVDYLFFVRKPDKKHHFFTASSDEFYAYLRRNGYATP